MVLDKYMQKVHGKCIHQSNLARLKSFEQNYLTIGMKMSISTTRINIHVIYIFHVYDKNVKNFQDVNSFDLLWINRHQQQLIQLSVYIKPL